MPLVSLAALLNGSKADNPLSAKALLDVLHQNTFPPAVSDEARRVACAMAYAWATTIEYPLDDNLLGNPKVWEAYYNCVMGVTHALVELILASRNSRQEIGILLDWLCSLLKRALTQGSCQMARVAELKITKERWQSFVPYALQNEYQFSAYALGVQAIHQGHREDFCLTASPSKVLDILFSTKDRGHPANYYSGNLFQLQPEPSRPYVYVNIRRLMGLSVAKVEK